MIKYTLKKIGIRKLNLLKKFVDEWTGEKIEKIYINNWNGYGYKKHCILKVIEYFSESLSIIEEGNDAPRGGKNGNYIIVEFEYEFVNLLYEVIDDLILYDKYFNDNLRFNYYNSKKCNYIEYSNLIYIDSL